MACPPYPTPPANDERLWCGRVLSPPTSVEQANRLPPLLFNVDELLLLSQPLVIALWRRHDALDHDELLGAARVKVDRLAGAVGDALTATGDVQLDVEVRRHGPPRGMMSHVVVWWSHARGAASPCA